ncbi:MAG: hypothetical protein IT285_07720, partial [Bdellovibrionales bacterium]|nr:hypothetical protein [Bdellovibrionales bacterium]
RFVRSLADSEAAYERVVGNPIFRIFAKEYSGTNEYMSLKRLDALHASGQFDLIVLDTPPSRNTLAFLDAPGLLSRFFDDRIIQWLVAPANKLMSIGVDRTLSMLESLTGKGFLSHLVEFSTALFEVRMPFAENLKRVIALLQSERCGVVLVAAPAADTAPDLQRFITSALERNLRLDGMILNRTYSGIALTEDDRARAAAEARAGRPGLGEALEILESLAAEEKTVLADLESCLNGPRNESDARGPAPFLLRVPQLARDVHTLEDLAQVAGLLGESPVAPCDPVPGRGTSGRKRAKS